MFIKSILKAVYKNLAIFWQDYFLGTGKIFLEPGKIFLEMARFFLEILQILKKSCQFLKKSFQILPKQNLAKDYLKSILSNIILNNFSLRIFSIRMGSFGWMEFPTNIARIFGYFNPNFEGPKIYFLPFPMCCKKHPFNFCFSLSDNNKS